MPLFETPTGPPGVFLILKKHINQFSDLAQRRNVQRSEVRPSAGVEVLAALRKLAVLVNVAMAKTNSMDPLILQNPARRLGQVGKHGTLKHHSQNTRKGKHPPRVIGE